MCNRISDECSDRRVLHLDMPRAFTTTLKTFDFRSAQVLSQNSVIYDQADLNSNFWQYAIRQTVPELDLANFFYPQVSPEIVSKFVRFFELLHGDHKVPLTPYGLQFGTLADSTRQIAKAVAGPGLRDLIEGYIDHLLPLLKLHDNALRVVSLGVDSANSLIFACAFAQALRKRLTSGIEIVLGKHSYENFSLSLRKEHIQKNAQLLRYFDEVLYHEERFAGDLLKLCGGQGQDNTELDLEYDRGSTFLIRRSVYMDLLVLPASHYVCSLPLSRNKCYWNKCTFCVQVKKHLASFSYDETSELKNAFAEISTLSQLGFHYFLFNDEAVQPAKLTKLCDFLDANGINIKWTPRIIADVKLQEDLIRKMARTGCFEVLFGLETISAETSGEMKKVSHASGEDDVFFC